MLSKIIEKSKWNFSRWLVMDHPGEDIYRLRQQYQHAVIDRMKVGKETRTGEIRFKAASHLKYSGENIKELLRSLPSWNTYSIFAEAQVDLTEPVEWRKDYKNNIVSDLGPGHKVKRKLFEEVGETKYVFELNRMHHLPVMALYAVVNDNLGDDMIIDGGEVVELIENQLVEWDKQNPYLNSINWSSGIEVALRAINLVYVRNILEEVYEPRYGLDILLDRLVVQHAHYLQSHLSLFSSANNHLVAELAGLVIICCSYEFNKSNDWLQMAWKRMLGQIKSQVNEDGFNKEQSTRYHAAAINSWLSAFQFAESNGMKADDSHWKKLDMMIGFLYKLGNTKGFTIEFGDSDDSELVYPYNDPDYNLYGSIHTSGAIQFDKQGYLKKYGRFDVRNYLVHGDEGFEKFRLLSQSDAIKEEITEASGFYKDSGYVIYNEDDSKLVFDVGFVGL
ncbi:MAG: hypothetical protein IIA45_16045, partial [Bacteroidetes bacterium]|nr:hypothetical protein [Bacteroidota bacterium]